MVRERKAWPIHGHGYADQGSDPHKGPQSRQLQIWWLKVTNKHMARQAPVPTPQIMNSWEDCWMHWLEIYWWLTMVTHTNNDDNNKNEQRKQECQYNIILYWHSCFLKQCLKSWHYKLFVHVQISTFKNSFYLGEHFVNLWHCRKLQYLLVVKWLLEGVSFQDQWRNPNCFFLFLYFSNQAWPSCHSQEDTFQISKEIQRWQYLWHHRQKLKVAGRHKLEGQFHNQSHLSPASTIIRAIIACFHPCDEEAIFSVQFI